MENSPESGEIMEIIEKTVEEIISKMGFEGEVKTRRKEGEEILICDIKTNDSSFLIGQYGINLQSLQHIARVLVRKKTNDKANFILDINSYRQEKNESVIRLAQDIARQCILEKRAIVLRPMSSYERRIIHLELSKMGEVKTESTGEGEDRRVVIKPADLV